MSATETVKTFITALQSGDMTLAANTMSENFVLQGFAQESLDKNTFLAMQSALLAAMPDFSYNLSNINEEEDKVISLTNITGTQLNELSLPPALGVPPIAATGLAVTLPQVQATSTLANDQILSMTIASLPGGGLNGLLQQIGTELPLQERIRNIGD